MLSSQNTAPMSQAFSQNLHPIHFDGSSKTPPPSLTLKAPTGQDLRQGGSVQALQTTTVKPLSNPPTLLTLRADLSRPRKPILLEHANMQS